MPADTLTAAAAVTAVAMSTAVAAYLTLATRKFGDGSHNSLGLVCDPLLQPFGVVAWVLSFAFSALWLLTHWRLQAFLKDPSKWSSWGSGGKIMAAREKGQDTSGKKLPMVSVLLPVKGVHEHTLMHWRSQVKASHGGPMEFIFCMESQEDPAYAAALDFRRECGDSAVIKVVSCGLSFYCSQKIHNLLKGVTLINKDSDYVLFLDDDAQMSSTILSDLVYTLEVDAEVMIASGWPNEYFAPDLTFTPTFASFMLLGYRCLSHLSMGALYPTVLWGGCLLLRRSELMDPTIGVLEAWKASGYSDDMIVIGRARKAGRKIVIPPTAFLPSRLPQDYTIQRHVNYMRRQMFACGTYHDTWDRLNNLFLLIVVSMVFVIFGCFNFQFLAIYSLAGILFTLVSEPQTLLPSALMQPQQCGQLQASPAALYLAVLAAAALWVYAKLSCYRSVILVCEHVAGRPTIYSNTIGSIRFAALLFLGVAASCVIHCGSAAIAFCTNSIVWSGVRYYRKEGHVSAVYRTGEDGKLYTVEIERAKEEAYRSYRERGEGAQ